ncbi:hypothetical protein D3C79_1061860 [compost metagenome]
MTIQLNISKHCKGLAGEAAGVDYKNQLRNLEDLYQITDRVIFLDADGSILNLLNFDNSIEVEAIFNVCLAAHYPIAM